ncbi:MAG: polysaccharide deacetylase family protein [Rhodomicrobium sp.]
MQTNSNSGLARIAQSISNRATRAIPVKLLHLRLQRPVASFTFDDFAKSAWLTGGKIVEDFGARATFYVSGAFRGGIHHGVRTFDEEDLISLAAQGHDIGCHTYDHIAVTNHPASKIEENLESNAQYVKSLTGKEMGSFAYPFGLASVRKKRLLAEHFKACRGIYAGINAGWADFSQLNALCLHQGELPIEKYIQKALKQSGWLIFVAHDVDERPSPFGCTPKVLENALRLVSEAGIEVMTVEAALRRILEPGVFPAAA